MGFSAVLSNATRVLRRLLQALDADEKRPLPAFDDPAMRRFEKEYEALLIETAQACPAPRRRTL